ncbi:hypothetical protein DYB36_013664 [Aphanomyces astaci]|uniref:FYVE-type domain-containing protein n=1 Tax=Aphanomyces astaci TaxID=112090 RepID=A0A396ZYE7_APHAT|nr:hypothetical protein DYB36_013664 [Aphanomyces astaci]
MTVYQNPTCPKQHPQHLIMLPTADVFDCQPLSSKDEAALLAQASSAWKGLVDNAISSELYRIEKVVRNETTGRCATLRKPRDTINMNQDGVVAHTRTRATIEQAAAFFYLDTSIKAEQFARVMDELVEAKRTLYTLVDRPVVDDGVNKPLDYISVDWMMIKFKKGVPARDLCYLEPGVLDYYKLYFGSPRGAVLGKHFNGLYLKGAMRTSARAVRFLAFHKLVILNLDEHFTTERLKPLLSTPLRDEKVDAKACSVCHGSFSWRTTKRLCRACGAAICVKCSSLWSLTLQGSAVKVPLCAPCVGSNLDANVMESGQIIYDVMEASRVSDDFAFCVGGAQWGQEVAPLPKSPGSGCVTVRSNPSDSGNSHMIANSRSGGGSNDAALNDLMCSIDQQKDLLIKMQEGLAARTQ